MFSWFLTHRLVNFVSGICGNNISIGLILSEFNTVACFLFSN